MLSTIIRAVVVLMMLRIGLDVTPREIAANSRNPRLIVWPLVGNYILVPLLIVALLLFVHANSMVAIAFLILSVCPGAPFVPPLTAIAKGNVTYSIALMTILAASSAILTPLLLCLFLPYISSNDPIMIDALAILVLLLFTQLLPLLIGTLLRSLQPDFAAKIKRPVSLLTNVLLLSILLIVLIAQYQTLFNIRLSGLIAMLALLVGSSAIGWFTGGTDLANQKASALTTAFRNAGVAMAIASATFPNPRVLSAVVAYTLVSVFGTVTLALWWGRQPRSSHLPARREELKLAKTA